MKCEAQHVYTIVDWIATSNAFEHESYMMSKLLSTTPDTLHFTMMYTLGTLYIPNVSRVDVFDLFM